MLLAADDRAEAHDRGARAMALHLLEGAAPPRSPWGRSARRTYHFRRGANRMAAAIRSVLQEVP